jgi:hypothetical protein
MVDDLEGSGRGLTMHYSGSCVQVLKKKTAKKSQSR